NARGFRLGQQVIDCHTRTIEDGAVRGDDCANEDAEKRLAIAEREVEPLERPAAILASRAVKIPTTIFKLERVAVRQEVRVCVAVGVHFEFREAVSLSVNDEATVVE